MSNYNYKTLTGIANWAMVLGAPVKAYNPDEKEWSIDFVPDAESLAEAQKMGIGPRIKNGSIKMTRAEIKKAGPEKGQKNKPIGVVDSAGQAWPTDKLIGNGSKVKVKFNLYQPKPFGGKTFPPKPAILEITVIEHVEYKKGEKAVTSSATAETWGEKV